MPYEKANISITRGVHRQQHALVARLVHLVICLVTD